MAFLCVHAPRGHIYLRFLKKYIEKSLSHTEKEALSSSKRILDPYKEKMCSKCGDLKSPEIDHKNSQR